MRTFKNYINISKFLLRNELESEHFMDFRQKGEINYVEPPFDQKHKHQKNELLMASSLPSLIPSLGVLTCDNCLDNSLMLLYGLFFFDFFFCFFY